MKTITSVILALVFSTTMFAQNVIDKEFKNLKEQENYTSVNVTSKMFELANYLETDEDNAEMKELKEFITTISEFNLIAGREVANAKAEYSQALTKVEDDYEELMNVEDKKGSFTFFIDEQGGIVNEVVMVGTSDEKELIIFSLTGQMNLRQLSKMASKIQMDGFAEMAILTESGATEVKVYPNPATDEELNIEVPANLVGGTATLINMDGQAIKSYKVENEEQTIATMGVPSGHYVLEIKHEGVTVKQRVVVQSK